MTMLDPQRFISCGAIAMLCVVAVAIAQTRPTPDRASARIHHDFQGITKEIGDLSDDEKTKVAAVEKNITDELAADPSKVDDKDFRESVFKNFRESLTADHQKKFDEVLARGKARAIHAKNANNLKTIWVLCLMYETDHDGQCAPDLGSLVDPAGTPDMFLCADSKTKPPADWESMDAKAKANWVNKNTDLIYLGAGKQKPADDFVMIFIKPDLATGGNAFLRSNGSVASASPEDSRTVADELKDGKNPPPSLK